MRALLYAVMLGTVFGAAAFAAAPVLSYYPAPGIAPMQIVSTTPAAHSVLTSPPDSVSVTFSQYVRPDDSFVRVFDLFGRQLNDGQSAANGPTLTAATPGLTQGQYVVKWQAKCACSDMNRLRGEFHFTVQ